MTFFLTIFATFMTRSGVVVSVHAFGDDPQLLADGARLVEPYGRRELKDRHRMRLRVAELPSHHETGARLSAHGVKSLWRKDQFVR